MVLTRTHTHTHNDQNPVRLNTEEMSHIPHCSHHTQTHSCVHKCTHTKKPPKTFSYCFSLTWVQLVASNIPKLKIYDLELSLLSLPPLLLELRATSHTGATTLPPLPFYSFQSSSLPPSAGKSSSWFFSLKRAEANWILAALQFPRLWLQAEGGGTAGPGRGGREESGGPRKKREKKNGREKCCVGHF